MDMVYSLGNSDPSDDPNKIYLRTYKNNPKGYKRTIFNDNKTKLLYPKTYKDVLANMSRPERVSFVYSVNSKYKNNYKDF